MLFSDARSETKGTFYVMPFIMFNQRNKQKINKMKYKQFYTIIVYDMTRQLE